MKQRRVWKFVNVRKLPIIISGLLLLLMQLGFLPLAPSVSAASTAGFEAGRIIDDSLFFDRYSMNAAQLQEFLNSQVPVCDRWHAQGGQSQAPPYTCLKEYQENTTSLEHNYGRFNPDGTPYNVPGGKTAAQIIYDVAQRYSISPKVLLVLLEKEQILVRDTWPLYVQFQKATGYACPDTAPCNTQYFGFYNQVENAAKQFVRYATYPGSYNYRPGVTRFIGYNPNASCGGANVLVQNQATANLYNYTPYQPNPGALAAGYGTAYCGAYGNRNFYLYYSDWFGPTIMAGPGNSLTVRMTSAPVTSPSQPNPLQPVTYSFKAKNFGTTIVTMQTSLLQCRRYTTMNCDSAYKPSMDLAPGQEATFSYTLNSIEHGTYYITPLFMSAGTWYRYGTDIGTVNSSTFQVPGMKIIGNLTMNPIAPVSGETPTYGFMVRNIEPRTLNIQTSIIQCRYASGAVCDTGYGGSVDINSGQEMYFEYRLPPLIAGDIRLIPYFMIDGVWYNYFPNTNGISSELRHVSGLKLASPITLAPAQPMPGEPFTVTYSLRNEGMVSELIQDSILQCRSGYNNCDPTYQGSFTLAQGETKVLTSSFKFFTPGSFDFRPYALQNDRWILAQTNATTPSLLSLTIQPYVADTRIVGPITASPSEPIPGQSVTFTYIVKNFGDKPAIYQDSILQCRLNTLANCDRAYTGGLTINPGEQRAFTMTLPSVQAGTYTLKPYYLQNGIWNLQKQDTSGLAGLTLSVSY